MVFRPFLLATGLVEGAVEPEHYAYDRYTAPQILALMDKVKVLEEAGLTCAGVVAEPNVLAPSSSDVRSALSQR